MKKLLSFILFVLMPLLANAVTVEIDGIYYNLDRKTGVAEVTRNTVHVYAGDVVIPEKVVYEDNEYIVTSIGAQAFFESHVVSVSLPSSITSIGRNAFIYSHSLDSIAIPEKVTVIEENAFANCTALRRVVLPEGLKEIGWGAFDSCTSLDSLNLPDSLEIIATSAFGVCKSLSSITIPRGLKKVGQWAFGECSSLQSVIILDFSSWCMIEFDNLQANPLYNSGKLILNGEEVTDLVIPEDVTKIGSNSFAPCRYLTSLTIGDNVTSIGTEAFRNCTNLTSVVIGEHVSKIEGWAFYNCSHLASVTCYPRKVLQTGTQVFNTAIEYCKLYVPASVAGEYAKKEPWTQFDEIISLDIPKHQLSYYVDGELYKSYTLEEGEYITPETVPQKDGYTFSGWSEIPETMPKHDVVVNGSFTLVSKQLTANGISYTLWEKMKTAEVMGVADNGISNFDGHLAIPAGVSHDGTDYEVTSIAASAFLGCDSLVSVSLPESILYIGNMAFQGCMLQNVFAKNATIQLTENAFSQATYNHAMLYIPTGKWSEAVYCGSLWRFINIRETATETAELSMAQAYTLMDAETFGYVVYDMVNHQLKTLSSFSQVEECSPENSWQLVDMEGKYGLYNIGAKKFASIDTNGKMGLSETPAALDLANGNNGVVIGHEVPTQWNFVLNDKLSIDQDIVGIRSVMTDNSDTDCYLLNGQKCVIPQKGVVVIKVKDGRARKVVR